MTSPGSSSDRHRRLLPRAPRLASTSARAAAPRLARLTGSPSNRDQHRLELALVANLDCRAVVEEGAGNLGEILHVRTKHDWLAERRPAPGYCGLQRRRGCRRRTPRSQSGRAGRARRCCRESPPAGEARHRRAARSAGRRYSRPRGPAARPRRIAPACAAPAPAARSAVEARMRRKASSTGSLLAFQRARGNHHRAAGADPEVAKHAVAAAVAACGSRRRARRSRREVRASRTSASRSPAPDRGGRRDR